MVNCPLNQKWLLLVASLVLFSAPFKLSDGHEYGKGFFNHTRCLYAYLDGGELEMNTADGDVINERLEVDSLAYDSVKSKCTKQNEPGKIVFSFKIPEKSKIKSVAISMRVAASLSEGYWEVSQANLTISRADADRRRTFPLKISDIYASLGFSYSCNELTLYTVHKKKPDNETGKVEPRAIITLERFQLQPFPELDSVVFGPSFDCSTWISLPGFMGFVLIFFITMVTVIGVNFLQKITTNDFKYNKEGQLFTQSQMESMKQQ